MVTGEVFIDWDLNGWRAIEARTEEVGVAGVDVVVDIAGGLLLVPQFTLAADTRSGTRPSFTPAASPAEAQRLFDYFVNKARGQHGVVETGCFGADMKVSLTNDGPVTFWLQVKPLA